jgi:hypothetical protein
MQSIAYVAASTGIANPSLMTVQAVRAVAATSINVNTVAGVPAKFYGTMGTPHTFTDPVTSEVITIISDATAVDFAGSVSGALLNIDQIAPGYTDLGSKVGDIVIIRPITEWANNLANIIANSLQDNGALKTSALDAFYKPVEVTPTNFISSGGIWSLVSGLNGTMTLSNFYVAGLRYNLTAIASRTYTASKDTYVDFLITGTTPSVVYTEVANGAANPVLAANSIRVAKIVTSASTITTVSQRAFADPITAGGIQTYPTKPVMNSSISLLAGSMVSSIFPTQGISTVETAPATYNVNIPPGCTAVMVILGGRPQSSNGTLQDMQLLSDCNPSGGTYTRGVTKTFTSAVGSSAANLTCIDFYQVVPGAACTFRALVKASAGGAGSILDLQFIVIPLGS